MANLKIRNLAMEGPIAEHLRDEHEESNQFLLNMKVISVMGV